MQKPPSKKAFIKTYGCQMNVYDSDRMRDVLAPLGYGEAGSAEALPGLPVSIIHPDRCLNGAP